MNWLKETPLLVLCCTYLPQMLTLDPNLCKDGYFGPDCLSPCRYPSYGADCQKGCLCDRNLCHYVTGCPTTDATDKAGQTPTLSVNDSRVLQNETKMNILYISSNVTGEDTNTQSSSMWTDMDVKHKAMLICTVFFGIVFISIIVIYIKITVTNRAHVQYFQWTRVEKK